MTSHQPTRPRPEQALFALILCLAGTACRREARAPAPAEQPPIQQSAVTVQRFLFYPAGQDTLLTPCTISMTSGGSAQQDMAELLRRYLAGPTCDGQDQPFPEHSALRAVFLVGQDAVVDLTGPVRTGGGSSTETSRVYGIVETLAYNFPQVKTVRILVDGQEVDTLLGHLDLSRPLVPEPRLLARSARSADAGEAGK